jgi:hypothetical protein
MFKNDLAYFSNVNYASEMLMKLIEGDIVIKSFFFVTTFNEN